ncbi:response regulator transcription factor [Frankia sp. Cr1]|uniref:response regulator transcription factor n=1 Tax=Frankia sp. Cr1 TaxID=3073931 RepID=UPI002AD5598F|nr:response regulator transcription factor [Frankia sp. Cr1]
MPDQIRICIADDHAVVRQGLRAFLNSQPDIDVVAEAATGSDTVAQAQRFNPDVMLVDLMMPGTDGFEAIHRIRQCCPDTAIVVLTSFSAEGQVLRALRAGALSYLLKDADALQIAAAIRKAARGEPVIATGAILKPTRIAGEQASGLGRLTNRELEVLQLIADGLSNALIAQRLVIGEGTVKTHVNNILSKLHLTDRTQAAVLAWRHSLVEYHPDSG